MLHLLVQKEQQKTSNLSHDNVLTLFDELILSLHDGLKKLKVLDMSTVCLSAVDKVLNHPLVDLTAELEVIHENVLHGNGL